MKTNDQNTDLCDFCCLFDKNNYDKFRNTKSRELYRDSLWHIIPTLGSYIAGYILLITNRHSISLYYCEEKELERMNLILLQICSIYQRVYDSTVICFEHGIVDTSISGTTSVNHTHLHVLPCKEASIVAELLTTLTELNASIYQFELFAEIKNIINQHSIRSYLFFQDTSKSKYIVDISNLKLPSQYLRKVLYRIISEKKDDGWDWHKHYHYENTIKTYRDLTDEFHQFSLFSDRFDRYETESAWIRSTAFLSDILPPSFGNKMFLDVGAGTGFVSEAALTKGWLVSALDCSVAMMSQILSTQIHKYYEYAEKMSFRSNTFELVLCRQGLQYMDVKKALSEMIRVSKNMIILCHATVDEYDVNTWDLIFKMCGYPSKRIFSTRQISQVLLDNFRMQCVIEHDQECETDESLTLSSSLCNHLNYIINSRAGFKHRNKIFVYDNKMYYSLRWHIIVVRKLRP